MWKPQAFVRFEKIIGTSTRVARIVTDQGKGYLKALGNPEGPHALAKEWVGTQLAEWFGLSTLEYALMPLGPDDEVPLAEDRQALPGPAFITRHRPGHTWSGLNSELCSLSNACDITRLVIFDTWVRNCDRYSKQPHGVRANYDNVFFSELPDGQRQLMAIDHTHCFSCGAELTPALAGIASIKDDNIYGLFPPFWSYIEHGEIVRSRERLLAVERTWVEGVVDSIPAEWEVESRVRPALTALILERAAFIADELAAGRVFPFPLGARQLDLEFQE